MFAVVDELFLAIEGGTRGFDLIYLGLQRLLILKRLSLFQARLQVLKRPRKVLPLFGDLLARGADLLLELLLLSQLLSSPLGLLFFLLFVDSF